MHGITYYYSTLTVHSLTIDETTHHRWHHSPAHSQLTNNISYRAAQSVDSASDLTEILEFVKVHGLEQVVIRNSIVSTRLREPVRRKCMIVSAGFV